MPTVQKIRRVIRSLVRIRRKPAVKVESKPIAKPAIEPKVKSIICYDSFGQPLPVRLETEIETHPINRIERLRNQITKSLNWWTGESE